MNRQPHTHTRTATRSFWYPVSLWAILLLLVFGFCMLNAVEKENARAAGNSQLNEEKASSELVLMGRYCMGAKSVYSGIPGLEPDRMSAGLLSQLKRSIRLPSDQVGLIPFIAEFAGREDVFPYIDELRNSADLTSSLATDLDQFEVLYRFGAKGLSPEVNRRLVKRYRWIAQMALTTGLPPGHPERALALKPATRTFFTALAVFGVILIGGLCGCGLFIVFIVLLIKKRMRFALAPVAMPLKQHIFIEAAVLFLALTLLLSLVSRYIYLPIYWIMPIVVAAISVCWPVWRGMQWGAMFRAIGWYKGKGFVREVGAGLLGYLAGLPLLACGCLATFYIIQKTGANPVHPIVGQFEDAAMYKVIGLVALACIMAPIIEETIFRGVLYRHLRLKNTAIWSALASGLIFAVIHPQGFAALPALGAIGVVLAILREWRGSLVAPMVAHAFNNLLVTMILVFSLWW